MKFMKVKITKKGNTLKNNWLNELTIILLIKMNLVTVNNATNASQNTNANGNNSIKYEKIGNQK